MLGVLVAIFRLNDIAVQGRLACEGQVALIVPVGIQPAVARLARGRRNAGP